MKVTVKVSKIWKWLALDQNGCWFFYRTKPYYQAESECWISATGFHIAEYLSFSPAPPWKKSLHKRNGNKWEAK